MPEANDATSTQTLAEAEQDAAREAAELTTAAETAPVEPAVVLAAEPVADADDDGPVTVLESGVTIAEATTIDVRQGGIGRAAAQDINVSMGGIGLARAERVSVELGGIGAAIGDEVEVRQGAVNAVIAREAEVEQALVQSIVALKVEVEEQVNVLFLIAGRVEGNVRTVFDWRGALAFGAVFGLLVGLLRRRD
jgi:hypothetical protein